MKAKRIIQILGVMVVCGLCLVFLWLPYWGYTMCDSKIFLILYFILIPGISWLLISALQEWGILK